VFQISVWGDLELCLGGLSPPKPPVTTGLLQAIVACDTNVAYA